MDDNTAQFIAKIFQYAYIVDQKLYLQNLKLTNQEVMIAKFIRESGQVEEGNAYNSDL